MAEGFRESCLNSIDRLADDELRALMADVLKHDTAASLQLIANVTPLFLAFFEGQAQAERVGQDSVEGLVQEAFMTLYRRRADYDDNTPFRAWLIEMARCTLLEHLRNRKDAQVAHSFRGLTDLNRHHTLRAI
ncbi:hypothetical protein K9857_07970 [Pseudomonas sp. REP124]|uniref:sigma factor n=1 Tax=Pseudomonas sp. REP124 TaxID=2875731 RepID=UPI001CC901A4|nr:sigma factor [Pseudomonas sp. REP124]MBZ9781490.1 hypothetical protein [Pseudomonas sp. REP124]